MTRLRYVFPLSTRTLYIIRILEIVFALVYLVLVAYSGVHHGKWQRLSKPLGFGSELYPPLSLFLACNSLIHLLQQSLRLTADHPDRHPDDPRLHLDGRGA